mmetsp:Transcript_82123/g.231135  ORF Transcript_82123/g.231135 Transcript_82123/m.231135 type:complete len:270 (+) Transcript_82123:1167-1976(+)
MDVVRTADLEYGRPSENAREANEVTPDHLMNNPIGALAFPALALVALHLLVEQAGGEAPMRQPRRELGHGLVSHATFGRIGCHGGSDVVQTQRVLLPNVGPDPLQGCSFSATPPELGTIILLLPRVESRVVGGAHDLTSGWKLGVRLRPANSTTGTCRENRCLLRCRPHPTILLHTFPKARVRIKGALRTGGVEGQIVPVIQLEAPEQAQWALTVPPEHFLHLAFDGQLLAAYLVEGEDRIHHVVGAQLLEASRRGDTNACAQVMPHRL